MVIVEKQVMVQDNRRRRGRAGEGSEDDRPQDGGRPCFDTSKAIIKPESDKAIGEIAKLLADDPALKVYVVGHTDSVARSTPA